MNSVVVFASRYGNTLQVADRIAQVLGGRGPVRVIPAEEAKSIFWPEVDLVVVGGPTEAHGVTPAVKALFAGLPAGALAGKAAAAFDTRLRWPRWLSGSAATGIGQELADGGAELAASEGSFLVAGSPPVNEPGELERVTRWAEELAAAAEQRRVAVPVG